MRNIIVAILWVIIIIGVGFGTIFVASDADASDNATLISEFEHQGSTYYMYLDDDLTYDGELDITLRKGFLHKTYISSIEMDVDGTTKDAIKFFKDKMYNDNYEVRHNDSLIEEWHIKQKVITQKLKSEN